ncbi:MAG: hypothetical protein ACKPEQ_27500, partial [Dolichospermum sp.]
NLETKIIDKILQISKPLSEYAQPCSGYNPYEKGKGQAPEGGVQTQNTVKTKPYHSDVKIDDSWKLEIVGKDISRYSLNITYKRWVKYGQWLAAPRNKDNFLGSRILVQEITGGQNQRIVATFYDQELYYSRDV